MPNTNKCWDCINCLRVKVRKGAELVTGDYGKSNTKRLRWTVARRDLFNKKQNR